MQAAAAIRPLRMSTERRQTASQLRLKNHHQRDCQENREASHQPADHDEVEQGRDQRQRQKNDRQAGQHFSAARPAKIEIAVVDRDGQQKDFHSAAPSSKPEMNEFLNHVAFWRIASVTRNAVAFSFTS